MEGGNSNWRPVQGDASGMNMDAAASGDWRAQLQPEARGRIVNKIMDTLQRHLPIYGQEGLGELRNIARRFEEKIFTAATNQSDYLRKISLKMLTMETKAQNTGVTNQMPSNPTNQNPPDPGSHILQPQVQSTGQTLPIPLPNQTQTRQQTLTPGIQNNLTSAAVQGSASLASMMPSMNGLGQSMSSIGQTSNLQSMSAISQNVVNNSGQSISPNIYINSQRQIQGKQQQQPLVSQQQPQNPHLYPQQLQQQQQMLKAKLSHPSLMQTQLQQQQQQQQQQHQQQPLLSATQLQSSQQPVMQITSSLQSSQTSLQQPQQPVMQSVPHSGHQQGQTNLLQQSSSPLSQQHPHAVVRQPQSQPSTHLQASSLQQQSASITQQSVLPLQQQQQQLLGNQSNISNMQQNQLLGQQSSIPDMQQQQRRLAVQQNNLMSMQQPQQMLNQQNMSLHQQVVPQNNISGLQQLQSQQHLQQQSQLFSSQPNMSNMHQHHHPMLMQSQKTAAQQPQQQQQQAQQTATSLMQSQGQQPQSHPAQQQHMSQIQSQPVQLQQQMTVQQQANPLQREMQQQMQQRLQASGGLLQPQNAFEQQKPLYQSQRALPEASSNSMDSTAQTSQTGPDWQEETYQKLQAMRDMYYADLNEIHQRIIIKCQQHEAQTQPGKPEQLESMKKIKSLMDRLLALLQMPKSSIQPNLKEKLPYFEKQMFNVIASNRRKPIPPQLQGPQQFPHLGGHAQSMPQQLSSQAPLIPQHDTLGNQMPPMVVQGSVTSMQSTAVSSMQNGSIPLSNHVGIPATQQNMNTLQPSSNIDSSQGSALTSLQEGALCSLQQGGMGSLQQATFNASTQNNMNTLAHTSNAMQPSVGPIQPNANILQNQHVKQEHQHQMMQSQQIKQQMQRQMQQQKLQILQQQPQMQQQYQQQQKQPQSAQLQAHQMPQLNQLNEMNDLKVRQASAIKSGIFQPHFPGGQRQPYHQQPKQGASFPISSPQSLQVPSPQISQHSSPQVEQGFLSSVPKAGTPLQSTNSPLVVPSPSTPLDDHEKQVSGVSSISNAVNVGHQQISVAPTQPQSLALGTPGISASPLLDECIGSDVFHVNAPTAFPSKSNATERPIQRLVKAVQSLSPQVLSSSVSDIGSVVSMVDRIAGSAPDKGSRAAIGEDLVAMTKCRLQARSFMSQDGSVGTKKMKRHTIAMPLNVVSSAGSVNDSFKRSSTDVAELESTATSRIKRPKVEATHALLEEIREINQQLIDTVVDITDEDADSIAAAAEGGEGTVVRCSHCAVAISPSLKSQFASAQASPISPLRLLVPSSYPYSSPVLLDKIPIELSKDSEDLSAKAISRFSISLRGLSQPMSLGEMVRTWDICARKVIEEYARQYGGGNFSSRYGSWENCVSV